jgi:hypothetical protein
MRLIKRRMNSSRKTRKNIKMVFVLYNYVADEEEKEIQEYKSRLQNNVKALISGKLAEIEKAEFINSIEEKALNSNFITESYIDRLSRTKTFNYVKDILENKIVVIRVDLDPFEMVYEDVKNEETGEVTGQTFKHIDFFKAKDVILPLSVNMFTDNRAKLVILLASFGPKLGSYNERYSMDHFIKYLQRVR